MQNKCPRQCYVLHIVSKIHLLKEGFEKMHDEYYSTTIRDVISRQTLDIIHSPLKPPPPLHLRRARRDFFLQKCIPAIRKNWKQNYVYDHILGGV